MDYQNKMKINNFIRQVMAGAMPYELEGILYYQDQIVEVIKLVLAAERKEWAQEFAEMGEWTCVHIMEQTDK